MLTVSKSKLKAKMLEYFRRIEKTGEEIIVTDNKTPVIRIVPIHEKLAPDIVFKEFHGKVVYSEDILENTSEEWSEM